MSMQKFVSYSQNFEDVMLWRALRHIENGFFVDVGAHDPIIDSVTKAFSCRKWTGINIEPVEYWFRKLEADRPQDINLHAAASSTTGFIEFFEVIGSGLSTTQVDVAQRHTRDGLEVITKMVPSLQLTNVLNKYSINTIHFLKIDVEGGEKEVLEGIDLHKFRPWIILIEATEPNSTMPSFQKWEHYLLKNSYMQVYFDGFNQYYLSEEHPELRHSFVAPPNVIDNFVQYPQWLAEQQLLQQLTKCQIDLLKITTSFSWRITKPMRAPSKLFDSVRRWFK
jgi:FkbM family methyltransferase